MHLPFCIFFLHFSQILLIFAENKWIMGKVKVLTDEEVAIILRGLKEGTPQSEIARMLGRPTSTVASVIRLERLGGVYSARLIKQGPKPSVMESQKELTPPKELTPGEMIKRLYDMGYRIENNKIVCYVKQVVNLSDIIKGEK